ncbi:MAG TPA: hypothetical protein DHV60_06065, partial [Verrucomicrobiales bacterium]|nr:hypothetical protein [Verrucomicrobiales bacterium]
MKAILYIVAIVAIAAGGWFSYDSKTKFTDLKKSREALHTENENRKALIRTKKKEAKDMEGQLQAAKEKRVNTEAELDNKKSSLSLAKGEAASWQSKIDEQQEQLDGYAKTKKEIQDKFKEQLGGRKVAMVEIPGLVKKLEDDLRTANRKLEELQSLTDAAGKRVASNNAAISDLDARMIKRAERIRANALQGVITAVNHDWGFAVVSVLIDDDEEEDEPGYDRISSYRRDTTALISLPGKENTGYVGIPLALGYNMFWTMGQTAMDVFAKYAMGRGGSGPMDFMSRNMAATLNSFNPIGGAGLGTAFMPTPVKPFFEVWANKNFMDAPIRMEDRPFEAPKPAHMMDPKRTQEHWTSLSKSINEFMGGSDQVKGSASGIFGADPLKSLEDSDMKWDISGSQLEHILLGYTGGPGQLLNAAFGGLLWPGLPGTSEDYGQFDANKMPITNRFYRSSTSNASTKNTYYQ